MKDTLYRVSSVFVAIYFGHKFFHRGCEIPKHMLSSDRSCMQKRNYIIQAFYNLSTFKALRTLIFYSTSKQ